MLRTCTNSFRQHIMVLTRSQTSSAAASTDYTIEDVPSKGLFRMRVTDSSYATVQYELNGDVYDLIHSQIPEALQGRGLGKILAKATFDHIAAKNKRMKLTCEYLDKVYHLNESKYKSIVNA